MKKQIATALHLLLIPAVAVAALLIGITHDAPEGGWVGNDTAQAQRPGNVPEWNAEIAAQFPACEAFREGVLVADVVIVDQQNDAHRLPVKAAVKRAHDEAKVNDMWVVGICR